MKIRTFFDPNGTVGGSRGCWQAYVFDDPGRTEPGATEPEAIGNLIMRHRDRFGGITVERDERRGAPEPRFLTSEPTD